MRTRDASWEAMAMVAVVAGVTRVLLDHYGIDVRWRDSITLLVIVFGILLSIYRVFWGYARFWMILSGMMGCHLTLFWYISKLFKDFDGIPPFYFASMILAEALFFGS